MSSSLERSKFDNNTEDRDKFQRVYKLIEAEIVFDDRVVIIVIFC